MKVFISIVLVIMSGVIIAGSLTLLKVPDTSKFNINYPTSLGFGGYDYTMNYYLDSSKYNYIIETSNTDGNTLILQRKDNNQEVRIMLNNPSYSSPDFLSNSGFIKVSEVGNSIKFVPQSNCAYIVIPIKLLNIYYFDTINRAIEIPYGYAMVDEHGIDKSISFKSISPFDIFYCKYI
ncbi:MAG: hypothetical protein ABI721_03435 [Candidatus Dojkabacteria bacterium]